MIIATSLSLQPSMTSFLLYTDHNCSLTIKKNIMIFVVFLDLLLILTRGTSQCQ